ncbi:unnamed protein product [Ilex paraguariensis]|uniref:Eyes absent homolog n=1 Tax=Ilex paraguariensis TaxID=185542 RepID=A0ABC8RT70_9AQUA
MDISVKKGLGYGRDSLLSCNTNDNSARLWSLEATISNEAGTMTTLPPVYASTATHPQIYASTATHPQMYPSTAALPQMYPSTATLPQIYASTATNQAPTYFGQSFHAPPL